VTISLERSSRAPQSVSSCVIVRGSLTANKKSRGVLSRFAQVASPVGTLQAMRSVIRTGAAVRSPGAKRRDLLLEILALRHHRSSFSFLALPREGYTPLCSHELVYCLTTRALNTPDAGAGSSSRRGLRKARVL